MFSSGHVKFELFVKHPPYQVHSRMSVEGIEREGLGGDVNLGVINIELVANRCDHPRE